MNNTLYPLKFKPILKDKIWGGKKLNSVLKKDDAGDQCGESWEISTVPENISVVSEGFLKGNNLEELIEIYMGDLVGEKIYDQFGLNFPLLIKFIDANDDLSIQVHPDDQTAKERHNSFGKTEMWYVIDADKKANLISGFNRDTSKEEYTDKLHKGQIRELMNFEEVSEGDVFFIPAGRVHAICSGILLAEIQQSSDITYRIYDWDRKDSSGNSRELHTEEAIDVIDFEYHKDYKTSYPRKTNESVTIGDCKYFTTNLLEFDKRVEKDMNHIDSFVIYMCTGGNVSILTPGNKGVEMKKGETVLLPAEIKNVILMPQEKSQLLEVYIRS